jgi:hypothetical protein
MALRISAGSRTSANHDRAEYPPIGFSGVEQDAYPVVLEVAKAKGHSLDDQDANLDGSHSRSCEMKAWELGSVSAVVLSPDAVPWMHVNEKPSATTIGR